MFKVTAFGTQRSIGTHTNHSMRMIQENVAFRGIQIGSLVQLAREKVAYPSKGPILAKGSFPLYHELRFAILWGRIYHAIDRIHQQCGAEQW
jgi:hypothetical protein